MTRKQYLKKKKRRAPHPRRWLIPLIIILAVLLCAGISFFVWWMLSRRPVPEDTVKEYFSLLNDGKYDEMYGLLSDSSQDSISEEDFTARNQNIYEGIEASDIKVTPKTRIPPPPKRQRPSLTALPWIHRRAPSLLTTR